jgi:hypothetical protein
LALVVQEALLKLSMIQMVKMVEVVEVHRLGLGD